MQTVKMKKTKQKAIKSSHQKVYTYVGSVSHYLHFSHVCKTLLYVTLMDKCSLHFNPHISNLAKKLSSLCKARPGEYRWGPLVRKNGSRCEDMSCQMYDQLELGGHELRQERQAANAAGKILAEREPWTAPEATPKLLFLEQQVSQMLPSLSL